MKSIEIIKNYLVGKKIKVIVSKYVAIYANKEYVENPTVHGFNPDMDWKENIFEIKDVESYKPEFEDWVIIITFANGFVCEIDIDS